MNFKLSGALSPVQLESIVVFSWGMVGERSDFFIKKGEEGGKNKRDSLFKLSI